MKKILFFCFLFSIILTLSCNNDKSDLMIMPSRITISDTDHFLLIQQSGYGVNGNYGANGTLYKILASTSKKSSEIIIPVDFFDINGKLMEAPRVVQMATIDEDYLIAEFTQGYFLIEKKDGKLWQILGNNLDLKNIQRDGKNRIYIQGQKSITDGEPDFQLYRLDYKSKKTIEPLFLAGECLMSPFVTTAGDIIGLLLNSGYLWLRKENGYNLYPIINSTYWCDYPCPPKVLCGQFFEYNEISYTLTQEGQLYELLWMEDNKSLNLSLKYDYFPLSSVNMPANKFFRSSNGNVYLIDGSNNKLYTLDDQLKIQHDKTRSIPGLLSVFQLQQNGDYVYNISVFSGDTFYRLDLVQGKEVILRLNDLGINRAEVYLPMSNGNFRLVGKNITDQAKIFIDFDANGNKIGEPIIVPVNPNNTVLNLIPLN